MSGDYGPSRAAPPADLSVDTSKIPITTCSEKARDAFLKGRWLAENLRITDAHEYYLKAVEIEITATYRERLYKICEPGLMRAPFYNADFGPHKYR